MAYKLKTHSGAAKRFKKTASSIKSKSANRNHILTKQSTKRKRHNRGLNKLSGTVLKMASKLIKGQVVMPRVTKSVTAKSKHKKILSATKGHYGARSRLFKTAKQSNIKSLQYAFRDRKNKKRSFRSLWIARINAASRLHNVSYSKLVNGLSSNNILLDRKILSDLSVNDSDTFEFILKKAVK